MALVQGGDCWSAKQARVFNPGDFSQSIARCYSCNLQSLGRHNHSSLIYIYGLTYIMQNTEYMLFNQYKNTENSS